MSTNPLLKFCKIFLSLKLTVTCLFLLMLLIFFGTLYQVEFGLHASQEKFFYSWILWVGDFVPMPGGKFVLWVLFMNLFASMMLHFQFGWRQLGLVMVHFGILLMLAGGWLTHLFGEESFLMLREGEAANLASGYKDWEISVWPKGDSPTVRDVIAFDSDDLEPGFRLDAKDVGLALTVQQYYLNAKAFRDTSETAVTNVLNHHAINLIQSEKLLKEPEGHMPGALLTGKASDGREFDLILFGGDQQPTVVPAGDGEEVFVQLRRRRYPLPMLVELLDFEKSFHPESSIPRAFSSRIKVYLEDLEREALIEMNEPFRYQGFTFYQASYVDTNTRRSGNQSLCGYPKLRTTHSLRGNRGDGGGLDRPLSDCVDASAEEEGSIMRLLSSSMWRGRLPSALRLAEGVAPRRWARWNLPLHMFTCCLVLASFTAQAQESESASSVSLHEFQRIPVLYGGRKMPMDTFARQVLIQLSGLQTVEKKEAISWFAEVIFTPDQTSAYPVFLINHPDVVQALGVTPKKRRRYSYAELHQSIPALLEKANQAQSIAPDKQSLVEKELIRVASNLVYYNGLLQVLFLRACSSGFPAHAAGGGRGRWGWQ